MKQEYNQQHLKVETQKQKSVKQASECTQRLFFRRLMVSGNTT
jgi:hypothetical protein